ncbi:hypothetical protein DUI87_18406 [Hirundo rustica rustica]|uniref:Protein kinase domain-containing protein n=1 Tax=Hirundo rustica rustica TaxID=333673 RepID=A0A3M0JW00_HIRRU|nr:hypothetical protein DUI87_18406 [Hirundo rustica rustica]
MDLNSAVPFLKVKGERYGEKADVWAAGCILYQMATLNAPFYTTNMLFLTAKTSSWFNLLVLPLALTLCTPEKDLAMPSHYAGKMTVSSKPKSFFVGKWHCYGGSYTLVGRDREEKGSLCKITKQKSSKFEFSVFQGKFREEEEVRTCEGKQCGDTKVSGEGGGGGAPGARAEIALQAMKNDEKLSLHNSSTGAASCKHEFSGNSDLPVDSCQSAHGKDEEITYKAILLEGYRTMEKDIFSEIDNDIDMVDNSSSSSSSNLKESAIVVKLIKTGILGTSGMPEGMTYEQLQTLIEEVIEESDYYSFSSSGHDTVELYKMIYVGRTCQFDVVGLTLRPTADDTAYD